MTINPLVAARLEGAKDPWSGIWIAEDIELISQGIKDGSWVDTTLGVVGASLDGLALISDPLGALLQYGVAWMIEHVKPLTEALDWLAGDPAQIAANAQTWRNMAKFLQNQATDLAANVRNDVSEWTGAASNAYRGWSPSSRTDRDVEELLVERGVEVDHVSVYRWVQRFTALLADAVLGRGRPRTGSRDVRSAGHVLPRVRNRG